MGLPGPVALLAAQVAKLAALVARLAALVARSVEVAAAAAQWEGTHDGELCNTTLSCQLPRYFLHQ